MSSFIMLEEDLYNSSKVDHLSIWSSYNLNNFLDNINAVKNKKPTNAGILFFSKNSLLRIPNAQLRLARIKGKEIIGVILL